MPEIRNWVKSVAGGNESEDSSKVIDNFDDRELKLEVRTLDSELDALDSKLQKLERQAENKTQELTEASSGRSKKRLKAELYDIKSQHDTKEEDWFNTLREKMITRLMLRAKERLNRENKSSVRELSREEFSNLSKELRRDLEEQNLENEELEELQEDIHKVMTSMGAPDGINEVVPDASVAAADEPLDIDEDMDGEEILDQL
jgi:Skp family chaperone for outer membrane proteins